MGSRQSSPVLAVVEGGLADVAKLPKALPLCKFDSRGEISLPFGMTASNPRKGVIEFYADSIKFPKVSVSSGHRFLDAQELFLKVARQSIGESPDTADIPMPLLLAECLEKEQVKLIPKRLQGKIILFLECFLTDSVGKQHIRTLEYNKSVKVWVKGTIPVFGAAFYPELFVVARCRLHFKGKTAVSNYFDDTAGTSRN